MTGLVLVCLTAGSQVAAIAQGRRPATLTAVRNATVVQRSLQGAAVTPVVRGLPLENGYVVRTNPQGMAETLFRDGRHVKLAQNTTLEISSTRADRMRVLSGKVWVRVPPRTGLQIDGLAANCHVTGTEFQLEVAPDGATTLTVVEGEVRFENPQGQVVVREAQQSRARQGQAPTPPIVAANLPVLLEWTTELQPVALLLEVSFISQDPQRLTAAQREAEALPAGPQRDRLLGDVAHDRGELTTALDAYERAIAAVEPQAAAGERAALLARIGQTWLELGKLPEAEAALRESLTLDPKQTGARAGLVMVLLTQRQNEAALAQAREAVAQAPGSSVAQTVLALSQIRAGEREAARQALGEALRLDPEDAQALAWHSFLLRAEGGLAEAGLAAQRAVERAPHSSLAQQSFADAAFASGRVREARRAAERAVALNPLSPGAHVSLGRALLQEGNIDRASREATKAVALDPNLERARFFRGVVLAQQRRYELAAKELERATQMDPGYLEAKAFLSRVYLEQGRRSEAESVAREAVERNPQFAPAHAALGRVYWRTGRLKEAAQQYQEAMKLEPGSVLNPMEIARIYLDQNNLPDALAHALVAVSRAPHASEAHAVLGLVYDRQENREQALREYREAVSLSPENSLARLGLVTAFTPGSFGFFGSGLERLRERAQALLRDPAVLRQTFEPGVTSGISGGLGGDGNEAQRYLHRGEFWRGRVHDLLVASRFSDEGYRPNFDSHGREVQSDIAIQATPKTQVLLQYLDQRLNGGLPGREGSPTPAADARRRRTDYNLHARQYLGSGTHLWLSHDVRAVHNDRSNPRSLSTSGLNARSNERVSELRLDHLIGPHRVSYGLMRLAGSLQERVNGTVSERDSLRDLLQYLQDDFRLGDRGGLIVGAHLLRSTDVIRRRNGSLVRERQNDLLPYLALTYSLDRRNLVRLLGSRSRVRLGGSLLAPSEAFIVGEAINTFFGGQLETYELDYERRFSARTFSKLFLQQSLVRSYNVQPSLDQMVRPENLVIPKVQARIVGLRFEHQVNRFLSGFSRLDYMTAEDESPRWYTSRGVMQEGANASQGLQVPFAPRWRGLLGLNYVDRAGTKLLLVANLISRQYTDVVADTAPRFGEEEFARGARRPSFGSHALVDLRIAREPSVRREYSLTIFNLFDKSVPDWPGLPRRGRIWTLNLEWRF